MSPVTLAAIFILLLPLISGQSGPFTLEIQLESYSNPTSDDCNGDNCDSVIFLSPTCENMFTFCLQRAGSISNQCTYGRISSTSHVTNDAFSFSSVSSELGLSDVLSFPYIPSGVSTELNIEVRDYDPESPDDLVDVITILFSAISMTTLGYTSSMQYVGRCGTARIQIRYQIRCSDDYSGRRCDCRPQPGRYICNSDGSMQCVGIYTGSECTDCTMQLQPDRFTCDPNGSIRCQGRFTGSECTSCTIELQPNKFTCNPDGTINCLGNFTGRLCSQCIPNHYGDNCSVYCAPQPPKYTCSSSGDRLCGDRFTGPPGCDDCIKNYYGENCNSYCSPQLGRYTCNQDGTRNCTGNFNGSMCLTCIPNYYRDNCSVYCFYPESASHFCDTYGNKVCKNSISPSCSTTIIYIVIGGLTILPCLMCLCFVAITQNIKKKTFAYYQN